MVSKSIKIYARIKKETANDYKLYDIAHRQNGTDNIFIHSNNSHKLSSLKYKFSKVFDQNADQEQLFSVIAKPIINRDLTVQFSHMDRQAVVKHIQ
ncbi:hypothetical protein GWI33_018747 [Rhynchophorus ferrugineus]|uniref:Kinesin motor domain-containing protein n=1 Tax=Rhynchophorus ferrugineus TaxID=354439 RepID=A0A834HT48_RHYFE|nr:hypothetical protein GWI33_018747 [Rhynchophorus ferrugineus]